MEVVRSEVILFKTFAVKWNLIGALHQFMNLFSLPLTDKIAVSGNFFVQLHKIIKCHDIFKLFFDYKCHI